MIKRIKRNMTMIPPTAEHVMMIASEGRDEFESSVEDIGGECACLIKVSMSLF